MPTAPAITDGQYLAFMQALATDQKGKNPLILSEWDQQFLASFKMAERPSLWFTKGRRLVTDRLWRRYGSQIGLRHPESGEVKTAEPIPGQCMYLVKGDDGRQSRCGAPASHRRPKNQFDYCDDHAEIVQRDLKKRGEVIHLVRI